MTQNIIFFGSGSYTIPVIEKLLNHNLKLVVTTEKDGDLIEFCKSKGIDFISTNLKSEDDIKRITDLNPTVAVLASFGAFIPESVIRAFQNGIINIHPSLLPLWKGPSPIQYTLLNSDTQTGVTLIKLDNEIDHGPILSQKEYNLLGHETTKELLDVLFSMGSEMVEELIIKLENGEALDETPQDHAKETWSYKIEKKDGEINLENLPEPKKLKAMINAYFPWPTVWFITRIKNKELRIKLLPEGKIQVEGKNPMNYKDFINGYGEEGKELLEKLNLN